VKKSDQKVYINSGNEDVLELIKGSNLRVLDIGCGSGSIAERLKNEGHIIDGITLSELEHKQAQKHLRHAFIYNLENGLPKSLADNEYDFVVCSHVLEHIAYPDTLLKDIKRVLKNDALIVVALPNVFYYKARWQLLKGSFKQEESGIWDYTHLRWYSFKTAASLLVQYGFTIELATVTGDLPGASLFRKIFNDKIRKKLFSILAKSSEGFWGYQLLYKARNIK